MSECEHGTSGCSGRGEKHCCHVDPLRIARLAIEGIGQHGSTPERMKLQIAIRALKQYEAGALSPEWARRALIAIAEIDG